MLKGVGRISNKEQGILNVEGSWANIEQGTRNIEVSVRNLKSFTSAILHNSRFLVPCSIFPELYSMYIKIYFDNKPLFLCNEIDEEIQPYAHHDDAVLIDELNARTVKTMIHEMNQAHVHAGIFLHP